MGMQSVALANSVRPLTLDMLARVVMSHVNDEKTVTYALCAASRLELSSRQGFAALNCEGTPVQIFWAADCSKAPRVNMESLREAKI
jgi:hypothetical protein